VIKEDLMLFFPRDISLHRIKINGPFSLRLIIPLLGIMLSLIFLQMEHHVECRSLYPDEVMDLQGYLSLSFQKLRDDKSPSYKDKMRIVSLAIVQKDSLRSIAGILHKEPFSLINFFIPEDTITRLSTLKRYNC